jgi:hypothetical protein
MPPRKIQSPVPFFEEAAEAATLYLAAKREHFLLTTEMRAKREGKRAAYGIAALVVGSLALFLSLFWVTMQIHEAGVASWGVALISLFFLGSITGILAWIAQRSAHPTHSAHSPHSDDQSEQSFTAPNPGLTVRRMAS